MTPTWRQLHPGDDPRVEAIQFAWFRDAQPWEKMRAYGRLMRSVRQLAMLGIRDRHPGATPEQLRRKLATLLLGDELAQRVYGPET